ncbi:hypothetical protein AVEN_44235-1 [Araneus ventricosus]|uniref:Uncharacterized protein n=1 Tax=Araneus ventricosus TaxID=182803 RepID=A0A4Y2P8P5_ARAVE|nr:hypothetical protein AVEN_44235-1 [Araneus ventricosus]
MLCCVRVRISTTGRRYPSKCRTEIQKYVVKFQCEGSSRHFYWWPEDCQNRGGGDLVDLSSMTGGQRHCWDQLGVTPALRQSGAAETLGQISQSGAV